MKERKDPVILEAFFSLWFFSFSSVVTRAFPWPIKGKVEHPMVDRSIENQSDPDPHKSTTRAHGLVVLELLAPVHFFHQRLGILSLSRQFVTPTTNFQC